jgi:lipoprotein-releasing system ATP-binding protein
LLIRTQNLTRRFPSGGRTLTILEDVNLEVAERERVAVVGESGAGKSTLLYLLGGLDRPTSGQIQVAGHELTGMNDARLARFRNQTVGFVWQSHNLLPEFTAVENVCFSLLIRGVTMPDAQRKAAALLAEVGLQARGHHRPGELSGGEQQRVGLARALCGDPLLLLADEPTGNLDPATAQRVMDLLAELHRTRGLTTILVTHSHALASQCDRVVRLASFSRENPNSRDTG